MYMYTRESLFLQVVRMDGDVNYRKTLLGNTGNETGVAKPISLAVDPVKGYWLVDTMKS